MASAAEGEAGLRMSELVGETGVSKELVHHYLRLGLLPPSRPRAVYTRDHVRLLQVIRHLREDHRLPLEEIKLVIEAFDGRPELLEPLVVADPPGKRLAELGTGRPGPPLLSPEQVAEAAGVEVERVAELAEAGLIAPVESGEGDLHSHHDVAVLRLCDHAVALGVPFDALRTVAFYVRVAFELEHHHFFDLGEGPASETLRQLFLRREVVSAFIQSVLGALVDRHLLSTRGRPAARGGALDDVVFRPSAAFLRRHGVDAAIDAALSGLARAPRGRGRWQRAAELLLHGGRYRQATFLLEQARALWPDDAELELASGVALVLSGEIDRGIAALSGVEETPRAAVYKSLALWASWPDDGVEGARRGAEVARLVDGALARGGADRLVRAHGGWLLTALPPAFGRDEEGRALLGEVVEELLAEEPREEQLPGERDRLLLNAAYLLWEQAARRGGEGDERALDELGAVVCRLDPGSSMAERVFLGRGEGR